jgi:hypothetical protein
LKRKPSGTGVCSFPIEQDNPHDRLLNRLLYNNHAESRAPPQATGNLSETINALFFNELQICQLHFAILHGKVRAEPIKDSGSMQAAL